jgi:AcrR family transcriptional regulator
MSTPAINPRKRPRQQRSEVTVDAILEATARILESDGLEALSTNAVAARAGVSVGSLYQYFPGKTALLAEVMRRERAALVARVAAIAAAPPLDLEGAVTALIEAAVAHQLERPALARALDFIEPTLPLDGETAALNADLARLISALIDRHGVAEPDQAARDLIALAKGMIDAAGLAGETNRAALTAMVARAALGYLRR